LDFERWFENLFIAANKEIEKAMECKINEYISRGIGRFGGAKTGSVNAGFKELEAKIKDVLDKTSALKDIDEYQWEDIKKRCIDFIEEQSKYIFDYVDRIPVSIKIDPTILKEDIIIFVDYSIELQKQAIWEKQKEVGWDIFKIFFAAAFGGLMALLIKK